MVGCCIQARARMDLALVLPWLTFPVVADGFPLLHDVILVVVVGAVAAM